MNKKKWALIAGGCLLGAAPVLIAQQNNMSREIEEMNKQGRSPQAINESKCWKDESGKKVCSEKAKEQIKESRQNLRDLHETD